MHTPITPVRFKNPSRTVAAHHVSKRRNGGNRCSSTNNSGKPQKCTLQDGEPAHERGPTTRNGSTLGTPKTAGSGRKHPTHTGAAEIKQHTVPNSPRRNLTNGMRLHPETRERSNKSTAPTATMEARGKHPVPERQPGPQPPSALVAHQ